MSTLGKMLEMQAQQERPQIPMVTFEKDSTGQKFKPDQLVVGRFLTEMSDWDMEVVHYVNEGPARGAYQCGKTPQKVTRQGKEQWIFVGDCAICDVVNEEADRAKKENRKADRKMKRQYLAYAPFEVKGGDEDNPTFEVKGIKLKIGDLYYDNAKGSLKSIRSIAKSYKGLITGRWVSINELGEVVNLDKVEAEDKKRQVELPDLATRLTTRTVDDYLEKMGKLTKANEEVEEYQDEGEDNTNPEGLLDEDELPFE